MDSLRRVLVIGGASDTEAVLKAVLEPRGTTVERTRFHSGTRTDSTTGAADVVVIDLDNHPEAAASGPLRQSNRVLIGSDQPKKITSEERFLAKPFQYPELVRMIEDLLDVRPAA